MLGLILRLLAAGDGDRGAGDSLKNLTTRWLVFGIAGIIFASGIGFGVLAGFWALESRTQDPILSAVIMVGILILAALLTAFIAYGITGGDKTPGPAKAVAQALVPVPVEELGRQIEAAAKEYGAVRVATAAGLPTLWTICCARRLFNQACRLAISSQISVPTKQTAE